MVATSDKTSVKPLPQKVTQKPQLFSKPQSFEAWLENPTEGTEWVKGRLIEKQDMSLTHSKIQSRLSYYWRRYQEEQKIGGEVYTEAPCITIGEQGRKPDVAYLTPELLVQYGQAKVLPQSFPLSAEIVSPTDSAFEVFAKAKEYLETGGAEVWLIFPENELVIIRTQKSNQIFSVGETVTSPLILPKFSVDVETLLD